MAFPKSYYIDQFLAKVAGPSASGSVVRRGKHNKGKKDNYESGEIAFAEDFFDEEPLNTNSVIAKPQEINDSDSESDEDDVSKPWKPSNGLEHLHQAIGPVVKRKFMANHLGRRVFARMCEFEHRVKYMNPSDPLARPLKPARSEALPIHLLKRVKLSSIPEDRRDCPICIEKMEKSSHKSDLSQQHRAVVALCPGGHVFGSSCIWEWIKKHPGTSFPRCPMCRGQLEISARVIKDLQLAAVWENILFHDRALQIEGNAPNYQILEFTYRIGAQKDIQISEDEWVNFFAGTLLGLQKAYSDVTVAESVFRAYQLVEALEEAQTYGHVSHVSPAALIKAKCVEIFNESGDMTVSSTSNPQIRAALYDVLVNLTSCHVNQSWLEEPESFRSNDTLDKLAAAGNKLEGMEPLSASRWLLEVELVKKILGDETYGFERMKILTSFDVGELVCSDEEEFYGIEEFQIKIDEIRTFLNTFYQDRDLKSRRNICGAGNLMMVETWVGLG
ncbi:hypothetical protein B0J14DRAFT_563657 [Halenospora varia]|nr:hypothetical protein B0J14DRAFT_563657 [Halenospora varia]